MFDIFKEKSRESYIFNYILHKLNLDSNIEQTNLNSYINISPMKEKASNDVWRYKTSLESKFKLETIFAAYFDSNPTNTVYDNAVSRCNILSFTIMDDSFTYEYDKDTLRVVKENKTSFDYTNKFTISYVDITNRNKIKKVNNTYNTYVGKLDDPTLVNILTKNMSKYSKDTNCYEYKGYRAGPGISELCAFSLYIIEKELDKNPFLSKKNPSYIFDIMEGAFSVKRAGDFGQIVLSKYLGYIFATNDYIQSIISIMFGVKTITTCGSPIVYRIIQENKNLVAESELSCVSTKKRRLEDEEDKEITKRRK